MLDTLKGYKAEVDASVNDLEFIVANLKTLTPKMLVHKVNNIANDLHSTSRGMAEEIDDVAMKQWEKDLKETKG